MSLCTQAELNETGRQNLLGLDRDGLADWLEQQGEARFRARQLLQWIYQRNLLDFEQMSDLSKALRGKLREQAGFALPSVVETQLSADGTCKWLLELHDGNRIETVFIPEAGRGTLCVSSQVGCSLDCSFCATARQGFNRNLDAGEIIAQVWIANRELSRLQADRDQVSGAVVVEGQQEARSVSNIVMMGMGEPLQNLRHLVPALRLMLDDLAYGLSKRRVTVSTAGVVPAMDKLFAKVDVSLAVSLHAATDALRDELVPLNRKYPVDELMAACWRYVRAERKKRVLFEYVLLAGVNDQPEHADALIRLLKDFPGKVNLIPFNPFPSSGYRRSSPQQVRAFADRLIAGGLLTLTRSTRGDDIAAACGQLAGDVEDRSRRYIRFMEPRFGEARTR